MPALLFNLILPLHMLFTSFLSWVMCSRSSSPSLSSPSHLSPPTYSLTFPYDERISSLFVTSAPFFLSHLQSRASSPYPVFISLHHICPPAFCTPPCPLLFFFLPFSPFSHVEASHLWKWTDPDGRGLDQVVTRRLGFCSSNSILRWNFKVEWYLLFIKKDRYLFSSTIHLTYTSRWHPG